MCILLPTGSPINEAAVVRSCNHIFQKYTKLFRAFKAQQASDNAGGGIFASFRYNFYVDPRYRDVSSLYVVS